MEYKTYSIGNFASMNKVSTRMLRHYDKIGLLQPVSILQNGYRCYNETQIATISQIKRLRGCGFLLDEIHEILQNESPHFLAEAAKRKLLEMQGQAVLQQAAIQSLSNLTRIEDFAQSPSVYGVSIAIRDEINLLALSRLVSIGDVEDAFDLLFQTLHRKNLHLSGCAVLLNSLGCLNEEHNRVGVPIKETYHDKYCQSLILPNASVISVIHYGDYYNIGYAYNALLNYAEQNGYSLADLLMERYFIDSSQSTNPNEYVTEISVTLKNTS